MTLLQILPFFVLLPLLGFLASLVVPRKKERILSALANTTLGLHLSTLLAFLVFWGMNDAPTLDIKHLTLYKSPGFEFFLDFYFDRITAVFALVGSVLLLLVSVFSRYYMHRDKGFKRFFNTLLLFTLGYNFAIFSGNFETLFIGWEILGLTSFLLIAFYSDRYLPVKNGFKVISFYRISDVCLMLVMWMTHHLWHKNVTFAEMNEAGEVAAQFQQHYGSALFIAFMIFVAAAVKSAQLPFSTWLPRAMEGPTTSSAIFYGALSVHIGVFLLLRTYPFWSHEVAIQWLIIALGLCTSLVATSIAQVQSSVKTQIAYASIAQIGLIFIEVAVGFHTLALIHFAGNAFLRTYQLLVSTSVLSYLGHDMFYHFKPQPVQPQPAFIQKIRHAAFILSIREWNLDVLAYRFWWRPFKWIGHQLRFVNRPWAIALVGMVLGLGIVLLVYVERSSAELAGLVPVLCAGLGLSLLFAAFTHRGDAGRTWAMIVGSQFFIVLSMMLNKPLAWQQVGLHLGGFLTAAVVGAFCLRSVKAIDQDIELNRYHGYSYEQPGIALVFLLCCLGLIGFPITPTFIGVDLMITYIHDHQIALVAVMALNLLFLELTILRIYTRIFLGQHKKAWHPIAFKSS